jgi:hypothetical protein
VAESKSDKDARKVAEQSGFIGRSSSEQAEENEHRARTPQGGVTQSDDGQARAALTSHTTAPGVVVDDDGNVVAVHTTEVITDPESPLAVQVPDPEVYPNAAGGTNPLEVHTEPSPNEASEEDAFSVVEDSDDEVVQSGTQGQKNTDK